MKTNIPASWPQGAGEAYPHEDGEPYITIVALEAKQAISSSSVSKNNAHRRVAAPAPCGRYTMSII